MDAITLSLTSHYPLLKTTHHLSPPAADRAHGSFRPVRSAYQIHIFASLPTSSLEERTDALMPFTADTYPATFFLASITSFLQRPPNFKQK